MSNDFLDKLQTELEAENRRFIKKCEEEHSVKFRKMLAKIIVLGYEDESVFEKE